MSEHELLDLARSCGQTINGDFAQVITITFAMVVAIYYFLHQAGVRMKIFAFVIYTCGMFAYLGMMLIDSGVLLGAVEGLKAIPPGTLSAATQSYLAIRGSWVGTASSLFLNLVFWVVWVGIAYLLFFWKKPHETAHPQE